MSDSTGYRPVELIFDRPVPDLFEKFLKKGPEQNPLVDNLQEKVLKEYIKMKEKAAKRNKRGRNGTSNWKPQVGYLVLAKNHAVSDAADGIALKFVRPYDAPWEVTCVINSSTYEVADEVGTIVKVFNQKALKPYLSLMD
jgi:hypothetical protein